MYKVQCFLFLLSPAVLLLEGRQLDTLLVSLHSSVCLLQQRTVKHVLSCLALFLFCFDSCKGNRMYVSIMGSGAAFGGTAPTISKAGSGRLKYSGIYIGVLALIQRKGRWMDGKFGVRSAGLGLGCAYMGWDGGMEERCLLVHHLRM